ncbi:hypothetical protein SH580_19710 [Coraliomargarita algicola]|uniref:Uncharacterized protein n=1 Tax=Coraliomargarita algicola TaxID=3092156 RepID=A0ABZ0RKM6_9BACT|nr:hypothetical protein [Coraliomargarita sp. J2-16]WPJ95648.1 hypothetical protein SH580_19710 [Coraliomargarita sp. J2-16]
MSSHINSFEDSILYSCGADRGEIRDAINFLEGAGISCDGSGKVDVDLALRRVVLDLIHPPAWSNAAFEADIICLAAGLGDRDLTVKSVANKHGFGVARVRELVRDRAGRYDLPDFA